MVKKISGTSITWTAIDEMPPEALAGIENLVRGATINPGVPFIKDNNVRSAFLLESGVPGCPRLFVKWFKKPAVIQRIRHLFVPSKALEEWRNLRALEKRAFPALGRLLFLKNANVACLRQPA